MTANAMQGDRELCEAAGMDDYVAKPIRVEELVTALERAPRRPDETTRSTPVAITSRTSTAPGAGGDPTAVAAASGTSASLGAGGEPTAIAPGSTGTPGTATGAAPAPGSALPALDPTAIQALATTMGHAFIAELIDTFGVDARELIAALRTALARADVDAFRRAAHSLKSTSETLGATRLAAMARDLEATARAGTLDAAGNRVDRLGSEYEVVAHLLGEVRRGLPA
jgi:HPt (histidine-containing phosphotransfer) domain-containing protein